MTKCPSISEIKRGMRAFRKHEQRDAMYRVAALLVAQFWGQAPQIADGLGVVLLTWNNAFYRFGSFDFEALERCLRKNYGALDSFRHRDITSWSSQDNGAIRGLFRQFSTSLQIRDGKARGRKSPVAVAKAMHMLAPSFFPLWDNEIALNYGCSYSVDPAGSYLKFSRIMKKCVELLKAGGFEVPPGKTVLKVIDEYNYAKFTKGWI